MYGIRAINRARFVATGLAAADDAAVTVGQLAQQVEILVVDEHRPGTDAVDAHGVPLDDAASGSGLTLRNHGEIKIGEWDAAADRWPPKPSYCSGE
jgi:hypothetical protein